MQFAPLQNPATAQRERPRRLALPLHDADPAEPPIPAEPSAWGVIWTFGGLVWLGVTCIALSWLAPWAGTRIDGEYVASVSAHGVQHALVFLVAALAYRAAVALGWPDTPLARLRVVLVNALLALCVVFWADVAIALVSGFVDGHMADMRDMLHALPDFLRHLTPWTEPLYFYLAPYVLGLCAIGLVMMSHRHHREALRTAELGRAYAAARMAMLSAQLQPHFLFNSLHAIMGLIDESPRQASVMLARLGDFLRHALEISHSPWVDVATELAGLEAYLAVQQTRFSDRLNIAIDASPEALGLYVPSLLLQPLAENAIEHGRDESGQTLQVRVAVAIVEERLCITVHNSRPRLSAELAPADFGRGLANVSLRLRAAYGADARLVIGPDVQGGTTATLDLPARRGAVAGALHS
jgi:two-component system LytT family sensor kinase